MSGGPRADAARNERLAEGNRRRGAPVADGSTGGNALPGGQTEPALREEVTKPRDRDDEA